MLIRSFIGQRDFLARASPQEPIRGLLSGGYLAWRQLRKAKEVMWKHILEMWVELVYVRFSDRCWVSLLWIEVID